MDAKSDKSGDGDLATTNGGAECSSASENHPRNAPESYEAQSPKYYERNATPTPTLIPAFMASSSTTRRNSISPLIPRKILSRNHNNTNVLTSYPSNLAELQLYRVMQNASLLTYYDTLLEMGGDDVQQLCDAGEEEFLEIMSLVGMASKPLHVRRFQKSLHEWVTHNAKFKLPLIAGEDFDLELPSPKISSTHIYCGGENCRSLYSPSNECMSSVSAPALSSSKRPYSPLDSTCPPSTSSSPGSCSSLQQTPVLLESQIVKLAAAAERLSKQLPNFEPKSHNTKKKVCKDVESIISMPETDPRRMEEIRRYAAIYGRFDCKRKPEKPLTLHEVSVNEAAAQICRYIPALLTRRDELFPLARQVVKDSGCYYSKTQLPIGYKNISHDKDNLEIHYKVTNTEADSGTSTKKSRIDSESEEQRQMLCEYSTDDMDDFRKLSPKIQVIAASGNNIIAVANPALAMSPAIAPLIVDTREADV